MTKLETLVLGLLATAAPACGTPLFQSSDPCRDRGGNPPTVEKVLVPLRLEDCASEPAPDAAAIEASRHEPPPACKVDCRSVCGRQHGTLLSCEQAADLRSVECVMEFPGRPCGRLFAGAATSAVGWVEPLVEMHALESISALAFDHLALELTRADAPSDLVARARDAAEDERRHALLAARLLEGQGLSPIAPTKTPLGARSLLELACENAVEGCVRETWGAMFALHRRGEEPNAELRRFYRAIADDELRHAEWSWDLDAWLETRLSPTERAEVEHARDEAVADLLASLARSDREGTYRALAGALFGQLVAGIA